MRAAWVVGFVMVAGLGLALYFSITPKTGDDAKEDPDEVASMADLLPGKHYHNSLGDSFTMTETGRIVKVEKRAQGMFKRKG